MLRVFRGLGKTLILIKVGIASALGDHFGGSDECLRIIGIEFQQFLRLLQHFVAVVRILVAAHRGFEEQGAQFAIGELRREVVGRLFHGGGIFLVSYRRVIGVEFCLRLGLRWPFALRRRRRGRTLLGRTRLCRTWLSCARRSRRLLLLCRRRLLLRSYQSRYR